MNYYITNYEDVDKIARRVLTFATPSRNKREGYFAGKVYGRPCRAKGEINDFDWGMGMYTKYPLKYN